MRIANQLALVRGDTAWCRNCNRRIRWSGWPLRFWYHPNRRYGKVKGEVVRGTIYCQPTGAIVATPRPQAKDISTEAFLAGMETVFRMNREKRYEYYKGREYNDWASPQELAPVLNMPFRVILAKAGKLMKQGIIDGCNCGCSGQFVIISDPRKQG